MLVHPNPMVKHKDITWEDTHLKRVFVQPILVNYGNHRQRWAVYARRTKTGPRLLISRHITEEQAVVSAQTLANRFYRLTTTRRKSKIGSSQPINLQITAVARSTVINTLDAALQLGEQGQTIQARERAVETVKAIQRLFQLNG